ncbi:MAG TPA: hypothetical protein VGE51_05305 [Fontimonas sp.]
MKATIKLSVALLFAMSGSACVYFPVDQPGGKSGGSTLICHKGKKTMELPHEAANGHIKHGDRYGAC